MTLTLSQHVYTSHI